MAVFLRISRQNINGRQFKFTHQPFTSFVMNTAGKNFSFPILSNADIVQTIQALNIPFTENDLIQPNTNIVRLVYEMWVYWLMGITKDQLSQPYLNATCELSHPDLYDESIGELNFFRAL
jgi:hypothetical protein